MHVRNQARRSYGQFAPRRVCCIRLYRMNEYVLFFTGMALIVMAPGPDFMNVVGQSLRGNLRIGMMSAVGVGAGLCVHVSAAILGLSAILLSSAFAYEAVRWVGAAYLIYLGARALLSRSTSELINISARISDRPSTDRAFRRGFLVNVLNPKVAITFRLSCRNSFILRKDRSGCNSCYSELSQSSLPVPGSPVLRLPSILPDPEFVRTRRFGGFRKR